MYDDYEGGWSLYLFLRGAIGLIVLAGIIYLGGLFISKFSERKLHFTLFDILKLIWLIISVLIIIYILYLLFPGLSIDKANRKFSEHVSLTGFSGIAADLVAALLMGIICVGGLSTYFEKPKSVKEQNFQAFMNCLLTSTQSISSEYFHLPVAYQDDIERKANIFAHEFDDIERERNYCYELFRQIRNNLPKNYQYKINHDVDKSGHKYITPECGGINPDFIIHRPGDMGVDDNLIIIEVKTFSGATTHDENSGFLKDIKTTNCMLKIKNGFYKGILIVFGQGSYNRTQEIREAYFQRCNQERILLIWHNEPLKRATIQD